MAVSNLVIARGTTDPTDLVLTFNVKADGVNLTTLNTVDRGYQYNGTLRNTLASVDADVPGDVATPATAVTRPMGPSRLASCSGSRRRWEAAGRARS
jgi:hypothetical protein